MDTFEEKLETELGRELFEELVWIHGMIRRDLATVRRLATEVANSMPAHELAAEIKDLKRWQAYGSSKWAVCAIAVSCTRTITSKTPPFPSVASCESSA